MFWLYSVEVVLTRCYPRCRYRVHICEKHIQSQQFLDSLSMLCPLWPYPKYVQYSLLSAFYQNQMLDQVVVSSSD